MNCTAETSWSATLCAWRSAAPMSTSVRLGNCAASARNPASPAGSTRNALMRLADLFIAQEILHRRELVWLHAEDEAIRRIGGRSAAPRIDQVVARKGEQQHRGQAKRKARDLHRVAAHVTAQVGETVAQRAAADAHAAKPCQRGPRH